MSKYGKLFKPLEKLLVEAGEETGEKVGKEAAEEAAEKAAKEAAEKAAKEAEEKAAREALEKRVADIASAGKRGENPLDLIPEDAERRVLTPVEGKAQYGVEYKWQEAGTTARVRAHGPDPSAPVGTNAHNGEVYRAQIGQRYMDPEGNLHPSGVHKPASSNYDPEAANNTHIPWPEGHTLPRE
ncbi:polymorphic toxin type 30 domain-containing protein [Flindersiella endophytica]